MDPFSVLGVDPGASATEVARAYRSLAKRWHPDRGGGSEAQRRMSEINAAYDLLRKAERPGAIAASATSGAAPASERAGARAASARHGLWLAPHVRRALRPELLAVLQRGEEVAFVTPVSLWVSPQTLLAVTDRRLLWLLDDAVAHRVRSLRFGHVGELAFRPTWPLRRRATLRVTTTGGRRIAFAGLRPRTAQAIAAHVAAAGIAA